MTKLDPTWLEKRIRIRLDIATAFSGFTGISEIDFLAVFYDPPSPPPIGDFNSRYIPSDDTLDDIFSRLEEQTGLDRERIESHFKRNESFMQYGERLLRSGAYS